MYQQKQKKMQKVKFGKTERVSLSEIYRRLNYFHKGDVNTIQLLLSYPSKAKSILMLGIIEPTYREIEGALNWYKLTELGKKFFSYYNNDKIDDETNLALFEGFKLKLFDYQLFENLKKEMSYYCPHCDKNVVQNEEAQNRDYFATCYDCDEDFYKFEVITK